MTAVKLYSFGPSFHDFIIHHFFVFFIREIFLALKVIHNVYTIILIHENKPRLNRHGSQSEIAVSQLLQGVFAVLKTK